MRAKYIETSINFDLYRCVVRFAFQRYIHFQFEVYIQTSNPHIIDQEAYQFDDAFHVIKKCLLASAL